MSLLSSKQIAQLCINSQKKIRFKDQIPVVKITISGNAFTWLLTEIDPQNSNVGYGLYIEFDKFATYGSVDLQDLFAFKSEIGTTVEVDPNFDAQFSVEVYKAAQWWYGHLIEDKELLRRFVIEPASDGQLSLFL